MSAVSSSTTACPPILAVGYRVRSSRGTQFAEQEYGRFAGRRRTQLEDDGEADTLRQLEDEVKKLPARKGPGRPKP